MANSNVHPNQDLQRIHHAAPVELYDDSHGLFGELIPPAIVLQGLQHSTGGHYVGKLDDPTQAQATQAIHSFTCHTSQEEVMVEFDNGTLHNITIRWLDEYGRTFDHYNWTMEAMSQNVRYSRLGHLFLITLHQPAEEVLLGAYRIRMPLPSGSPHYIRIEQTDATTTASTATITEGGEGEGASLFLLEAALSDPSGQDELVVAAESLDTVGAGPNQQHMAQTIKSLNTIVGNLSQNPEEPRYQSLRLSNSKVQSQIANCWGAMHVLHTIGFQKDADGDHLNWRPAMEQQPQQQLPNTNTPSSRNNNNLERVQKAAQLLQQLQVRSQPGFVAELAPNPPWRGPVLSSSHSNNGAFGHDTHRGFLSDDEKWQRAERNRSRRGRSGRRPDPGNAPSSNGPWGR